MYVIAEHLDHVSFREIVLNPGRNHLPLKKKKIIFLFIFSSVTVIQWIMQFCCSGKIINFFLGLIRRKSERNKKRGDRENAKRVLNVRYTSRWTTGLCENILASVSPGIWTLVWLSIGWQRDSIICSIMASARDENGNRAIAGTL